MSKLLIKNIGCLQTPVGSISHWGPRQGENRKLFQAAVLIEDGRIEAITSDGVLPGEAADTIIDAQGNLVTPGLVEGHTHLVFGGYRQGEIPLKLKGAGYLDILKNGGGILDTVRKTRQADAEELYQKSRGFLDEMMALGVTTCEAKSGYGLDLDTEVKMLEVIRRLDETHPMDLVATFMGAHAVPPEYEGKGDEYIELLCREMIPYVKEHGLAQFSDVFCEDSVFSAEQSEKYLQCAKDHGLGLKIHADEIEEIGGSQLAGRLGAVSAEHLIAIGEKGLNAMAEAKTTAMLLPATSFYLGKDFAPARTMIEKGIPVAIASDFNPGSCPSLNLQFAINLGYLKYKMTPEEILTAVTINPACAIGRGSQVGTLEVGKQADLVIWDAPDMEMLCYRFGSNLALQVIKKGELVL
ncbi:imidazolonepropionase [Anaerovorax odorimutans]|uniref:Imidazolonepropionase n=1 Tax=Anaerovorax odorimutans TaxID=109327 RepID=A0ABT1RNA2_9FIRM|nr:imidazolonepropionase [Anaerovorax odorimutans]MCQ4636665.1 imidazolonepropionase [Anaerovorax odorimutans]